MTIIKDKECNICGFTFKPDKIATVSLSIEKTCNLKIFGACDECRKRLRNALYAGLQVCNPSAFRRA